MDLQKVFTDFCAALASRQGIMTEDNVRYYWFRAMLRQDRKLNNYTLEFPYDSSLSIFKPTKKELDLLYNDGKECWCMEMKFNRKTLLNNPKSAMTVTDNAGHIFNDLLRLSVFQPEAINGEPYELPKETHRYFLYVTDEKMDKYLNNTTNPYRQSLSDFYNKGRYNPFIAPTSANAAPQSFCNNALQGFKQPPVQLSDLPIPVLLHQANFSILSPSFKGGVCHVRLYEVQYNNKLINQ